MLVAGMLFFTSYAQERVISGKVTAEDGSAVPGVNVLVKGTTSGTVTDVNGNYTLSAAANATTLVFSFIGYTTIETEIAGRSTVDIQLAQDVKQLSEVVVVGYGTQIKQDLTGNIARVNSEDLQNQPVVTFEQSVQGRAAGVFIENGNGKLGQGMKMRIRGSSSVSAGNQPLYVIDGIPVTSQSQASTNANTNPLVDINPNDIESIDILKDASASAIYGSRAANGVVLITTKRGKTGRTTFGLNLQTGFSEETNRREFLNTKEYVELLREAGKYSGEIAYVESRLTRNGAGDPASWQDPSADGYVSTDWQDQIFRKGKVNQFDLSASGGNEKTRFFASLSYSDQEGILVSNRLDRASARLNLDQKATDKLSFGLNFSLSRTRNFRLSDDNAFSTPMQIVALMPVTPVIDPRTGLVSGALSPDTGIPNGNYPLYYNPLLDINYGERETSVFRNLATIYASYDITRHLTFKSEFGYDLLNQHEERYFGKETSRNTGYPNGWGTDGWTRVFNYTTNNFFMYTNTINDKHTYDIVVGTSYQESSRDFANTEGQQFPSNSYKELVSAASITAGTSRESRFSFLSYFARANFKFSNRYLIGISGRVDGSSRFGAGNKYGFFPAASAGWILSEESFLADNTIIEFLKLRASYGITGNAEIDNFASRGLYSGDGGVAGVPGQRPTQLANPDLKWEQTSQFDIGFDFGFFNNRVNGEVDYYIKKTQDLLLDVNLPGNSGFATQTQNIGELENKGIELVVNTENLVGDFRWSTSFNIARNRNKVTNLNGQVIEGDFLSRAVEGEPIGIFYGPKYAGVDPANGDALYYKEDADGTLVTTNDINEAKLMKIGDPNPDYIAGITNTFSYKNFDLSILFQGVFGNDVYNGGGKFMSANGDFLDNQTKDQLRRWQNPGDVTDVPQARLFGANGTGESSRYVSDATYVRIKNITLGYNLPAAMVSKIRFTKIRLYVSALNLLTFTDYEGWDPEVNSDTYTSGADQSSNNINQGIDFYSAPQAKTITFGLTASF